MRNDIIEILRGRLKLVKTKLLRIRISIETARFGTHKTRSDRDRYAPLLSTVNADKKLKDGS